MQRQYNRTVKTRGAEPHPKKTYRENSGKTPKKKTRNTKRREKEKKRNEER